MSTTNETNALNHPTVHRLRVERRLFRRLTEEERAARFKRIMELLHFLFEAIPALNATPQSIASDLWRRATADLDSLNPSLADVPTDNDKSTIENDQDLA
jgi:hypothetical protein